jgi:hypothetical protein
MITTDTPDLANLSLSSIARLIRANWKKVNYAASPYLSAMASLHSIADSYGYDNGKGIVRYFLSNASSFRGETAKAIKAELNRRLKA